MRCDRCLKLQALSRVRPAAPTALDALDLETCESCINASLIFGAVNRQHRLSATLIAYRTTATLARFRQRKRKQDFTRVHTCISLRLPGPAGRCLITNN